MIYKLPCNSISIRYTAYGIVIISELLETRGIVTAKYGMLEMSRSDYTIANHHD